MWPKPVSWKEILFGIEIEFVGGTPHQLDLLPGWILSLDEKQIDDTGMPSGSELKPPPLYWRDRHQIRLMVDQLKQQGAMVNWSCGLHVHISLEPWGQEILLPFLDVALAYQERIQSLLQTSTHRLVFCPPITPEMRQQFIQFPSSTSLRHQGRPRSHRCGINLASWFDYKTVEIRYANGSLNINEIFNTIEFCLRFVSAIGSGKLLPPLDIELTQMLEVSPTGYLPSLTAPYWFQQRCWLEELFIPVLTPLVKEGQIESILPTHQGLLLEVETPDGKAISYILRPSLTGWEYVSKT